MSIGQIIPAPLNGFIVGLFIFFSTLFGCVTTQFLAFVFIRPFSRKAWKFWNMGMSDTWFRFVIFLMEYWNGFRIRLSGDELPVGENVLLISNHPSEADWFFTWSLGWRKKSLGNVKICIKSEFKKVPGLGWAIDNLDYPFMSRRWEFDEALLKHATASFKEDGFRLWFHIFPEGTDFSEAKQQKSWQVADQNGWPKYKHLLVPRTKGFVGTVGCIRDHANYVYDLTIGYPNKERPSFFTALSGRCPSLINIHAKRYSIKSLPEKEEDLKQWLFDRFKEKDELLDYFDKHQKFPGAGDEFLKPGYGVHPVIPFILWTAMVLWSFWGLATSPAIRWFFFIGWATFVPFAYSSALRRWRGLDPPHALKKTE